MGTLAQGCQIELLDSSCTIRLDLRINRASGSLVANTTFGVNLGPGDYTVRAYDWEQDMSTTRSLFVATAFTLNDNGSFGECICHVPMLKVLSNGHYAYLDRDVNLNSRPVIS